MKFFIQLGYISLKFFDFILAHICNLIADHFCDDMSFNWTIKENTVDLVINLISRLCFARIIMLN